MSGYLQHFGLKVKPFATTPDPQFAYGTREHQLAVAKIQYAVEERQGIFLLQGEIGAGKCLGRGTPVLLYDGTTKAVEDVCVGDLLMGPDSTPRRVLSLARGVEPLYRVVPKKGLPYVVNESHILSLKMTCLSHRNGLSYGERPLSRQVVNLTVQDYLSRSKSFRSNAKGWRVGVEFEEKDVPLDPYFLGLWLGDGTSQASTIHTMEAPVIAFLEEYAAELGLNLIKVRVKEGRCPRFDFSGDRRLRPGRITPEIAEEVRHRYVPGVSRQKDIGLAFGVSQATVSEVIRGKTCSQPTSSLQGNAVLHQLRTLNLLNNKHIPLIYRANSRPKRLALLAGLIDSDGSLSNNGYDLIFKQETLAQDVAFLARSLGLAAYVTPCAKTCTTTGVSGRYYRISISGDTEGIPVRIPRKQAGPRRQKKDVLLTGIHVEPIGLGEYFGFEIEGDRLFLLGDFTVTHNTTVSQFMLNAWRQDDSIAVAHITNPVVRTAPQFLRLILSHFGEDSGRFQSENWEGLRSFLVSNYRAGKTTVLVIDEAQAISAENMETLTHISNEQTQKDKLIQIVLLAQPNIARKLTYKPALRDRIAHGSTLNPLSFEDAVSMLRHRVQVAGGDFDALFPDEALHRRLYNLTKGVPRRLCMLCDNALLNAYALGAKTVDDQAISDALDDLSFKGWKEGDPSPVSSTPARKKPKGDKR